MNPLQAAGLWLRCNRTRSFLFIVFLTKHQLAVCSLPPPGESKPIEVAAQYFTRRFSHIHMNLVQIWVPAEALWEDGWAASCVENTRRLPGFLLVFFFWTKPPATFSHPSTPRSLPPWGAWSIIPLDWSPKSHLRGGMHSLRAFKVLLIWWCWWWWWWCR